MPAVATKPRSAPILTAGMSESPSNYLNGIRCDLKNMEDFVRSNCEMYRTLDTVLDPGQEVCHKPDSETVTALTSITGHGQRYTGNIGALHTV